MTTTIQDATMLANQLEQDALIFNAIAPGATLPLLGAIQWGGETFAGYAFTQGGNLATYYPGVSFNGGPVQPGDPAGYITQIYENALARMPMAADLAFYENIIATVPNEEGWVQTLLYIGISPESQQHNAHLMVHI